MIRVDALEGCPPEKAREIVEAAKFPAEVAEDVANVLVGKGVESHAAVLAALDDATFTQIPKLV